MTRKGPGRPKPVCLLVAAAVTLAGSACLDVSVPTEARVEISGSEEVPVRVVTSTRFVRPDSTDMSSDTTADGLRLLRADTLNPTLPVTLTRQMARPHRIYVQVSLTDSMQSAVSESQPTEVRLFLDGERRSRVTGDLTESPVRLVFASYGGS